ncbi:DUF938 domain-containing protein [Oceaniglobus indicus]|uniref:DUF938 domain-containing protein n=1 Tax=Oceaniglobus indicus TaxID=2047749 RepID=UPI000C194484|nr:DUF938 domain-containing protein [Oceaniglobus indicus]
MTGAPTSGHTSCYIRSREPDAADDRLFSRVVARNSPPTIAALSPWLTGLHGTVLEIGCGTGQHAAQFALAFPHLTWLASDIHPAHRASAQAWARELGVDMPRPLDLDAAAQWGGAVGRLAAVVAMNVIHIAPPAVMQGIIAGAGQALDRGGLLVFYGPFIEPGVDTGPGNIAFDAALRADDPRWGLRDTGAVRALGQAAGLSFTALIAVPANNRILILRRD